MGVCKYLIRTMLKNCDIDLFHLTSDLESKKHKLKRLVQCPNSYFIEVKCPGCSLITTTFSHSQSTVICESCGNILCTPTGGKARLTEGVFLKASRLTVPFSRFPPMIARYIFI